jgi:hypothetical protein
VRPLPLGPARCSFFSEPSGTRRPGDAQGAAAGRRAAVRAAAHLASQASRGDGDQPQGAHLQALAVLLGRIEWPGPPRPSARRVGPEPQTGRPWLPRAGPAGQPPAHQADVVAASGTRYRYRCSGRGRQCSPLVVTAAPGAPEIAERGTNPLPSHRVYVPGGAGWPPMPRRRGAGICTK